MATDETFDLFHKYNRLVRRKILKPLEHVVCNSALTTTLGPNDELVLFCVACDTTVVPGEGTISTVRAVVKEHYE